MKFDLNDAQLSERNGTYGGKAGSKEGILIDGEYWIVKYPQSTKGMRGALATYTTAPLSEYIGSHIYAILGIETHETILGTRNEKLVVACRDFCKTEGALREIRVLKNIFHAELNEKLEMSMSSTHDSHLVNLEDILIHFAYNPVLRLVPGIEERFWQQVLIDVLINNNDRNNGNWGVLYEDRHYRLAPVFDNGAAFSNKLPDDRLLEILHNPVRFAQSAQMSKTVYALHDKPLLAKDLLLIEEDMFYKTAGNLLPAVWSKIADIVNFINGIPETIGNFSVCSDIRKRFYIKSMLYRLDHFLLPVFEKAAERGLVPKDIDVPDGMRDIPDSCGDLNR